MPTEWFTSDPHVGHKNIIKYCNRPFTNTDEMDKAMIRNWNAVVAPEDTVRILGDLAFCTSPGHAYAILSQLNGIKHVTEGNHDAIALQLHEQYPGLFASWNRLSEVEVEGQRIVLSHYAMREWHHALRGVWHLFGHTHATLRPFGKSVDVGVDNVGEIVPGASFRPVSFAELKVFMDKRPIGPHPQFEQYKPGHPELCATSYTK